MDLCVIYNPAAARGCADGRLGVLRQTLGSRADFRASDGPLHAEELSFKAAQEGFAVVGAAGGDGTISEVANGIIRAGNPEIVLAVFPLGSANDYAHSLGVTFERSLDRSRPPRVRAVDVGLVRGVENAHERYFVNSLGLGFSGAVTVEARKVRRLKGLLLYSVGFFRALWFHFRCPAMEVVLDDFLRQAPTFSLTLGIGRREGNFVVNPDAVLDDGLFDYLHVGRVSRREVLRFMPRISFGWPLPDDHPFVWKGRCKNARVRSEEPLMVHLDGEIFSCRQDGIRNLEVRLLPGALRVQA